MISLGLSIALRIAFLVISLKTILLVFVLSNLRDSYKCQAIASPSLSSSLANQTVSACDACFFNSLTTSFLSFDIIYFGLKLFSKSIPISFLGRSEIWP